MDNLFEFKPEDLRNLPTFRAAYSDRTALLMGRLAKRAYEMFEEIASREKLENEFGKLGLKNFTPLVWKETGTAGFVAASSDIIVVVFRGTEDDLDWQTNLRIEFVELQGGTKVHTGFFQAYFPIQKALFEAVEKLIKDKERPVYLTGHSLGGALAAMATAELANHEQPKVRDAIAACYTFGAPRIGDGSFDMYVKPPLYRVLNGYDPVPFVPFLFLGYRNVGDTRYFGKQGTAPARYSLSVLRRIWGFVAGVLSYFSTMKIVALQDHQMKGYVGKMLAWADKNIVETEKRRDDTTGGEMADGYDWRGAADEARQLR